MASSSSGSQDVQPSPPSSNGSIGGSLAPPPTIAVSDKPADDSSKLKLFLGILRKFIGVTDIASARFSLPAQLLEPTPNLEYWNYLDRPETFISIGDPDDGLGRMLALLRFWFTKDLKYVKGKPCKPYNSALGEFFRCTWEVEDPALDSSQRPISATEKSDAEPARKTFKVSYLTEQTSHHPPVSAFYVDCPEKGITARGFDQLSVKFTGTSLRVTPGAHNLGIFVTLSKRDNEEYQLTHPVAHLGGILRGTLNITVADTCYLTCPKTRLKVILHYQEEGWLGRTQNKVVGVIFNYDPDNDTKTKVKEVPEKDIIARIEGNWQDTLYYTLASSNEKQLLIDLNPLFPVAKHVPPEEDQLPTESRRFWHEVTTAILAREYGKATAVKQQLEERQREKAAARQANKEDWQPRFFTPAATRLGRPDLSDEGVRALKGLHHDDYRLETRPENGVLK
ncbi:MAG: hypothetical protein M1825_000079 [Sarcosagium campestre]|nr:MAG: hypothetical protein M1825_000079 [Sarcosagium campestre]